MKVRPVSTQKKFKRKLIDFRRRVLMTSTSSSVSSNDDECINNPTPAATHGNKTHNHNTDESPTQLRPVSSGMTNTRTGGTPIIAGSMITILGLTRGSISNQNLTYSPSSSSTASSFIPIELEETKFGFLLWNLWTIWDPSLAKLSQPGAKSPKRRRMDQNEFRNLFLANFATLSPSFQFPNNSGMPFMTVEVIGEIYLPGHKKFANIPIRLCDFEDFRTADEDWILKAHTNLGVLLSLTFKIGDIVLVLGGCVNFIEKRIYLNHAVARNPKFAHVIHLGNTHNRAPENPDIPFSEAWSRYALEAKLQLVYSYSKDKENNIKFTILKTSPYLHQSEDLCSPMNFAAVQTQLPMSISPEQPIKINNLDYLRLQDSKVIHKSSNSKPLGIDLEIDSPIISLNSAVTAHKSVKPNSCQQPPPSVSVRQNLDVIPETPPTRRSARRRSVRVLAKNSSLMSQSQCSIDRQNRGNTKRSSSELEIIEEFELVKLDKVNPVKLEVHCETISNNQNATSETIAIQKLLIGSIQEGEAFGEVITAKRDIVNNEEVRATEIPDSSNGSAISKHVAHESLYPATKSKSKIQKDNPYVYHSLGTLKNMLNQDIQMNSLNQICVYGVVDQVLPPDKPSDYKIRISDETLNNILVRIHISASEPKIGPRMRINNIIRIHRCCVQNEVTNQVSEMVISTTPHHNYVLFNHDSKVGSPILKGTNAKNITFLDTDKARVIELREFIGQRTIQNTTVPNNENVIEEDKIYNQTTDLFSTRSPNLHERLIQLNARNNTQTHMPSSQSLTHSVNSMEGILLSEIGSRDSDISQLDLSRPNSVCESILLSNSTNCGSTLLKDLAKDRLCFTMKCSILSCEYIAAKAELYIRVSDGTISENHFFVNLLDDALISADNPQSDGRPYVDISVPQIDSRAELWTQISEAEECFDLWILTHIKIVPLEDETDVMRLVLDIEEATFERYVQVPEPEPIEIECPNSPKITIGPTPTVDSLANIVSVGADFQQSILIPSSMSLNIVPEIVSMGQSLEGIATSTSINLCPVSDPSSSNLYNSEKSNTSQIFYSCDPNERTDKLSSPGIASSSGNLSPVVFESHNVRSPISEISVCSTGSCVTSDSYKTAVMNFNSDDDGNNENLEYNITEDEDETSFEMEKTLCISNTSTSSSKSSHSYLSKVATEHRQTKHLVKNMPSGFFGEFGIPVQQIFKPSELETPTGPPRKSIMKTFLNVFGIAKDMESTNTESGGIDEQEIEITVSDNGKTNATSSSNREQLISTSKNLSSGESSLGSSLRGNLSSESLRDNEESDEYGLEDFEITPSSDPGGLDKDKNEES